MRIPRRLLFAPLAFALWLCPWARRAPAAPAAPQGVVTLFHAGSLSVPLAAMERAFEAQYPAVDLRREASGSSAAARKISDLGKPCDLMAAADYRIIDKLLRPEFTAINIHFASNRMVLCYTAESRSAARIDARNWMEILPDPKVRWGHAEPDLDPCGYRALMVLQLAENHYQQPGLYRRLMATRHLANVRPKAVELVPLLETGNLDYAWEYRSVAVQHGLQFIELPAEINLGDSRFDPLYREAAVEVSGKTPGSSMLLRGQSIIYGVTLLNNAPNRDAALAFLRFMLDPAGGLQILREQGQPPLDPPTVESAPMKALLPREVQPLVRVAE